jgi:hypothetical protein
MFSFEPLTVKSKCIAVLKHRKTGKNKRLIYKTEKSRDKIEQKKDFQDQIDKFCDTSKSNKDCLTLKDQYEFEFCPPNKLPNMLRANYYINGRSGSGKSWYINDLIEKYDTMYPENEIYYVSCNDINNDISYSEEMKKRVSQLDLSTITSIVEFDKFKSCFFLFDDILDVNIALDIEKAYEEVESENKKPLTRSQKLKTERQNDSQAAEIKKRILQSIVNLSFAGRKQEISICVVDHKMFSGRSSCDIMSDTDYITLFPYSNMSKVTLIDFLMKKVSLDRFQSKEIAENEWVEFDFLTIGSGGRKFYITPTQVKLL